MPSSASFSSTTQFTPDYDQAVTPRVVLSIVATAIVLLYHLLRGLLRLPSPLTLLILMIPESILRADTRERLCRTFEAPGGVSQVVSRARYRAVSFVGGGLIPRGYAPDGKGLVGGLFNYGNTCYQNSVLQALASLYNLPNHLRALAAAGEESPSAVLAGTIQSLNELTTHARAEHPADVLVRGSAGAGWLYNEQQDAQEFYQNLTSALDKDVKVTRQHVKALCSNGLESVARLAADKNTNAPRLRVAEMIDGLLDPALRSPFEGLLGQRVGCTSCGHMPEVSLIEFSSISLPLPPHAPRVSIDRCLAEYTSLEHIPEVECERCTLLAMQSRYKQMASVVNLPDDIASTIRTRLESVETALEDDNYSPSALPGIKITLDMKVRSHKTKQVMIARAPPVLVLHINRSVFNMYTGQSTKNTASVLYPAVLDLSPFSTRHDRLSSDPRVPISPLERMAPEDGPDMYELKAVVAHFGGHHQGHYYVYRKVGKRWFKISDHEVRSCEEMDALSAGNAVLLFYELIKEPLAPEPSSDITPPSIEVEENKPTESVEEQADDPVRAQEAELMRRFFGEPEPSPETAQVSLPSNRFGLLTPSRSVTSDEQSDHVDTTTMADAVKQERAKQVAAELTPPPSPPLLAIHDESGLLLPATADEEPMGLSESPAASSPAGASVRKRRRGKRRKGGASSASSPSPSPSPVVVVN